MKTVNIRKAFVICLLTLTPVTWVQAYSPELGLVLPRGGTRGQDVEIHLYGKRMLDPKEIIFYKPGVSVKNITKVDDKHVKALLTVAADAPLGEHPLRLRCQGGVTYMRTFWIGQFPTVKEVEPNNDYAKPQQVDFNSTVHGTAGMEDADFYQITAKKGQRISAEIEGMRLGAVFFDPYIAILDGRRFELATSDDTPLLKQDAFVSVIAPEDGQYTLLVRESAYEGNNNCRYRLHIGGFSRPAAVYPPAAKPGIPTTFKMIGDSSGNYNVQAVAAGNEGDIYNLFVQKDGLSSPSPNPVLVSSLPFANEKEPNNESKQATPPLPLPALAAPCAFHGVIGKKGDVDWFRFSAKKGQNLRVRVRGRSLRSPLDSILILRDTQGKQLGRNDDQGSLDSIIDFKPPADGEYRINVRDHLKKGGPGYVYRVEINHRKPKLSATLPLGKRNDSQYRKVICVPRGNRYATVVNISRKNLGCDCTLRADSLPQGVTMQHSPAPKAANNFLVLFEAKADAPIAGGLHHFSVLDAKPGSSIRGDLKEVIHHVEINNTGVFHSTYDNRVTVAVIVKAPFHVDLHVPPVPIVRNGSAALTISLRRSPGFDEPVKLTLPWKPPGLGAPTEIMIPKGKNSAVYTINASADAALGNHQICITAESNTKKGLVVVSSAIVPLVVAEPLLSMTLEMASTTPGQNTALLCKVNHNQPIQGKAQVILHGLPHGVKSKPKQIDAHTKEVIFDLEVAPDATKGNHNALFCQVLPQQKGHIIAHNTGHGGTLRINPPAPKINAKGTPKPKTPKNKTTPAKPKKPLSRLEELRQRKK